MPIYEFLCESCGRVEERLQKLTDPPPNACAECGGKMAKIMSRNSFQLKGGGWYKDLYSSPAAPSGTHGGPAASTSAPAAAAGTSAAASSSSTAAAAPAAAPSAPAASTGGSSAGSSGGTPKT